MRETFFTAALHVAALSVVVVSVLIYVIAFKPLIGPALILMGLLPWLPLRLVGRPIKSVGADIVFGMIDTGFLAVAALIGASFAGALGAIVGGAAGDSITDAVGGLFEGRTAEWLRRKGIDEARTAFSSSMGKMSGCLLGVGIVLSLVWSVGSFI